MKKLVSNYLFVLSNQLLTMIVPLITMPYITRVLLVEGVGRHGTVVSVVGIFVLFAMMSIPLYGTREIAVARAKGRDCSGIFFSIYAVQLATSTFVFLAYLAFVFLVVEVDRTLYLISILTVGASILDISWYFFGVEKAKKIAIRNMIVRVISVICIFTFVNSIDDLPIYVLILSLAVLIGQIVMWGPLLREIKIRCPKWLEVRTHLRPILILFLPSLAILTYGHLNVIFLDIISGSTQVGFYRPAFQIIFLILGIMTSVSTVMMPRMANEFSGGHIKEMKVYLRYVLQFVLFISMPLTLGMIAIAENMVLWYLGNAFEPVAVLLYIMAAKIVLVGLTNVFGLQVLVAVGEQNKYTIAVTVGALVGIGINLLLAFRWGAIATALALLSAEIAAVMLLMIFAREFYQVRTFLRDTVKYTVVAGVMYGVILLTSVLVNLTGILLTIFQVLLGGIVYLGILLLIKDSFIWKVLRMLRRGALP